jgi:hypothetical protein
MSQAHLQAKKEIEELRALRIAFSRHYPEGYQVLGISEQEYKSFRSKISNLLEEKEDSLSMRELLTVVEAQEFETYKRQLDKSDKAELAKKYL